MSVEYAMPPIPWLQADSDTPFPPVSQALTEPDGLLCAGADLSPQRLLQAYTHGIFPWFSEGEPILWWSPDPRMVFRTNGVRLPSKFRRQLRRSDWTVRADTAFAEVIRACADSPRDDQDGTWIMPEMQAAYIALHRLGHAHSVEAFEGERLIGGIYGVAIGRMFFGESMFSAESGGSKLALAGLAHLLHGWGWPLLDAQVDSPHLRSLGAVLVPRSAFLDEVSALVRQPGRPGNWTEGVGILAADEIAAAASHG